MCRTNPACAAPFHVSKGVEVETMKKPTWVPELQRQLSWECGKWLFVRRWLSHAWDGRFRGACDGHIGFSFIGRRF